MREGNPLISTNPQFHANKYQYSGMMLSFLLLPLANRPEDETGPVYLVFFFFFVFLFLTITISIHVPAKRFKRMFFSVEVFCMIDVFEGKSE